MERVTNPQLVSTVALVAALNTDLDAVSDEIDRLRMRLAKTQDTVQELETQAGLPAPRRDEYCADSPPRKRPRYGTAEGRTTVED